MLNLKRKAIAIAILAIPAALASAQSNSSVLCTNNPDDVGYRGPMDCRAAGVAVASPADRSGSVSVGLLGTPAQSRPDSTIKVRGTTGSIYVEHLKTARIENDKGQSFTWQFDSPMSVSYFPLKAIAPSGFDAGNTQVVIVHPALHNAP